MSRRCRMAHNPNAPTRPENNRGLAIGNWELAIGDDNGGGNGNGVVEKRE